MNGRLGAALVVALILIGGMVAVVAPTPPAQAARMCPPVTLDDLFPPPTQPPPAAPSPATPTPTLSPGPTDSTTTTSAASTTTPSTVTTTSTTVASTTTQPPTETTVTTAPGGESTSTTTSGGDPAPNPAPSPPPSGGCAPFSYNMRWPLAGDGQMISGFGTDRGDRHHKGFDISAPKLTPVVAVADSVVMKVVQEVGTEECCWVSLRHTDGWQSYYIHLNNDQHGTDDGLGVGVRPDLVEGMEVREGEVIGWVGDSGNAEETIVHLHFELRTSSGVAIDARPSLVAAKGKAELLEPQPSWPYADDDGLEGEWLAADLVSQGLFLPCDETMATFCPDRVASPQFAEAIVTHFAGKAPPPLDGQYQSLLTSQGSDRETATAMERAVGCSPFEECFVFGSPATEVARVAAWARIDSLVTSLLPKDRGFEGSRPVVNLPSAEDAEKRLRAEGAIGECNRPLDSHHLLTRGETLTLLASWVRGSNPEPCSEGIQRVR